MSASYPAQVRFDRINVSFRSKYSERKNGVLSELATLNPFARTQDKKVIFDATGVLLPGKLTAILGPSGAGKTMLLNVLSGRIRSMKRASISGDIYVNREKLEDYQLMQEIVGVVEQEDLILGTMTVREALLMSATLRMPNINAEEADELVENTIKKLYLDSARDTYIGTKFKKGVSGGERKRTSIGMELITKTPILFLDEPTSGLDAFSQLTVVRLLSSLAKEGKTVTATIHSPSSQMLKYFDDVIIIAEGRIIYQGTSDRLIEYFSSIGYDCPRFVNPADFVFLDVIHSSEEFDLPSAYEDYLRRIRKLCNLYDRSVFRQEIEQKKRKAPNLLIGSDMIHKTAGIVTQTGYLVKRSILNQIRDPYILFIRVMATILLSTFIALVYLNVFNSGSDPVTLFQSVLGSIFFLLVNQIFLSFNGSTTIFAGEKPLFLREYSHRYYGVCAYFFSKLLIEIPLQIIFPVITSFIVYWVIGYKPGFDFFLLFALFLILVSLCGAAFGLATGAFFNAPEAGVIVAPLFLLPLIIYGGYFVNSVNSPSWLAWIQWISPIQYAFTGVTRSQLSGRTVGNYTGEEALQEIRADKRFPSGIDIVFLVAIFLFFLFLGFLSLVKSTWPYGLQRVYIIRKRKEIMSRK